MVPRLLQAHQVLQTTLVVQGSHPVAAVPAAAVPKASQPASLAATVRWGARSGSVGVSNADGALAPDPNPLGQRVDRECVVGLDRPDRLPRAQPTRRVAPGRVPSSPAALFVMSAPAPRRRPPDPNPPPRRPGSHRAGLARSGQRGGPAGAFIGAEIADHCSSLGANLRIGPAARGSWPHLGPRGSAGQSPPPHMRTGRAAPPPVPPATRRPPPPAPG